MHFYKCCWFPPRSRGRLLRSAAVHRQSFHFETEDTGPAYTHPDENSTPQFTRAVQHNMASGSRERDSGQRRCVDGGLADDTSLLLWRGEASREAAPL